ncbi:DUF2726 domain-containing protein [Azonexus sp.]|uniref:DUF2726 domain-containing protein n=1 Tax=Azonexus sp. TaxID=1872668 RepID=UPI0039E59A11
MGKLVWVVVLVVLVVVVLQILKGKRGENDNRKGRRSGPAPYFKKMPLSEPEQVVFHRLREALPDLIVLAQVAMPAMVGIRKNENWQSQFNEISRKHVDFVVCMQDFSIKAVIELDDSTHQRGERIKSDAIKDAAFQNIGVPVIRFDVREMPSVDAIRTAIKKI